MNDNLSFDTIDGTSSAGGTRSRRGHTLPVKLEHEKGKTLAKFALALTTAKGDRMGALAISKNQYGEGSDVTKALVAAASTSNAEWAGALVPDYQTVTNDFIDYLRPRTIIYRLGQNGISDMRRIGFRSRVPSQIVSGSASWVAEGRPLPVTKHGYSEVELGFAKLGAIATLTREVIAFSNPNAETVVRDGLASSLIETLDRDFLDPDKAEVPGVSPASVINGIDDIPSVGGSDIDAVKRDLEALFFAFLNADNPPDDAVFLMSSKLAFRLSALQNMFGQREFPEIHFGGGRLMGLPVLTSNYIPVDRVILLNPREVYFAEGGIHLDASDSVSLELRDDPTNDSVTPTGAQMTSMFQTSTVALKILKAVNWKRRRESAAAWLSGVQWGAHTGS